MRGLTPLEWEHLEGSTLPDPCNDEWECDPNTPEDDAATDAIVARGLAVRVPCVYDPSDWHLTPTPLGRAMLSMGRDTLVSDAA